MARMKRKRKYRSSAFSKSSWNKRVSCRQNMRKGRIKANYKRRAKNNPNYDKEQELWERICVIFLSVVGFIYMYLMFQ